MLVVQRRDRISSATKVRCNLQLGLTKLGQSRREFERASQTPCEERCGTFSHESLISNAITGTVEILPVRLIISLAWPRACDWLPRLLVTPPPPQARALRQSVCRRRRRRHPCRGAGGRVSRSCRHAERTGLPVPDRDGPRTHLPGAPHVPPPKSEQQRQWRRRRRRQWRRQRRHHRRRSLRRGGGRGPPRVQTTPHRPPRVRGCARACGRFLAPKRLRWARPPHLASTSGACGCGHQVCPV